MKRYTCKSCGVEKFSKDFPRNRETVDFVRISVGYNTDACKSCKSAKKTAKPAPARKHKRIEEIRTEQSMPAAFTGWIRWPQNAAPMTRAVWLGADL
jgi:hypothetical protein